MNALTARCRKRASQVAENFLAVDALVFCYDPQNRVQCAQSKIFMRGNRYPLVGRSFGFKNDVASDLVNNSVVPTSAEEPD